MSDSEEDTSNKQLKVVIVGDGASGKTSLATRFAQDQFGKQYNQTLGIDWFLKRLELPGGIQVAMQVWDIGGQTLGGQMLDKYLYGAHGVMMVYDITNYASFENLEDWIQIVKKSCVPEPKLMLVGNKMDMEHMRTVKVDKHNNFAKEHRMMTTFTSARTGESVSFIFLKMAADICNVALSRNEMEQQQQVVKAEIIRSEPKPVGSNQKTSKSSTCSIQ